MPMGIYISVPFCKSKCSFCNFASGVFSRDLMQRYVERVCAEISASGEVAAALGAKCERDVDSIYLGGGTPSTLEPQQLEQLFAVVRENFAVSTTAEITVECAPGTLSPALIETLTGCGVNRVSLGVQSFMDKETRSVARLHNREIALADMARLRAFGITNFNVDLIAGLPHQTAASWDESLDAAIATGSSHVSVYMLEVDEDSRLGKELIAGGTRYHAHHIPDEELTAALYGTACERLTGAGIQQYEISNFARAGFEAKHNLKYWTRQPYYGFGLDAHSMLPAATPYPENPRAPVAVRFATGDSLEEYISGSAHASSYVSRREALEEEFFLGLRLNRGIDFDEVGARNVIPAEYFGILGELEANGLLQRERGRICLTPAGRLLSNEVFARFLADKITAP